MPKISTQVVCVNDKQPCSISIDRSADKTGLYLYTALHRDVMLKRLGWASLIILFNALIGFWTLKEILSLVFDTCILYKKISVKFSRKQQKSGSLTWTFRFWGSFKLLWYLIAWWKSTCYPFPDNMIAIITP